ncbi:2Fe-2S iron-sulfur cluster-binding protein [Paraburkholderia kururiensis]|uniref:2Fe-2S iron-sulfur cluster-binding protein n=1 Tax=Paraburkholderia kururiensis TaxID=984307 RepID=UPI0003762405|nr:2Fe-2S iron-sulfur cluster-binding protein [Paraburkholderia kururiensis]
MRDIQRTSGTPAQEVHVMVDGHAVVVPQGATVAAALAVASADATHVGATRGTRVSVRGEPRTMFCGMGVCQECRVTIDGRAHRLACQTLCREGQRIETMRTE